MKRIITIIASFVLVMTAFVSDANAAPRTPFSDGSRPVIMINDDALFTDTNEVNLKLHMSYASEMLISNHRGFVDAKWQPYTPELKWKTWTDNGEQYVFVMFRNGYGTSEVFNDSIFYQTVISTNRKTLVDWIAIAEGRADINGNSTQVSADGTTIAVSEAPNALPAGISAGDLIKIANGASVYYIGLDHKRHIFPSEIEYGSWNRTFSAVKDVPVETISHIPLGKNMSIRPGTYLVKISSDPKTYAVDGSGKLRWITSEVVARALYGNDWRFRVIDLDATRFADYQIGTPITEPKYLDGTVVRDTEGKPYRVSNGKLVSLSPDGYLFNDYQERFTGYLNPLLRIEKSAETITGWITDSLPKQTLHTASR